jgi:hypothetical protein
MKFMAQDDTIKKEAVIEGGPEVEISDATQGIVQDNPPASEPGAEVKELMNQLQKDREDFDKEKEEFRKEWDTKVDEIESLRDLYDTPNAGTKEEIEVEIEEPAKEAPAIIEPGKEPEESDEFIQELRKEVLGEEKPRSVRTNIEPTLNRKVEDLEVRLAEIQLKDDLREAQIKYPKLDREEVLLGIERDPSKNVFKLAELSQQKREAKEKQIREEIESQLKEEGGSKTMPSHPGSAGIPPMDNEAKQPESKDPWDKARRGAKADLGIH